jgi:integrase
MRHMCVALMIAEGANPLMVQRQLGRADLRMTLGTYGAPVPRIGMSTSPIGCGAVA